MKNYMKEVAELLGLEFGEEFKVEHSIQGIRNMFPAKITCDGIEVWNGENRPYCKDSLLLGELLTGECAIKKLPWKPKYGDKYFHVSESGDVITSIWDGYYKDRVFYKIGNCYKNKESAFKDVEKWKKFYESDEVINVFEE